ncbi:hypothetical protein OYC64_012896 [Pagothenia borchgrevinki]|uniref:Peptidase M12A domain-containing protein n=1 Tax=Pagothenia borchgrevinki TaxID=8213 RepID=A0ABD2FSG2_PAGBO
MDDIAYDSESERNADPCTSASCMWAKSADGKIYVCHRLALRYAFSGNNMPTMVPIPNANVEFGTANQMSRNDISRLNTLYKC